MQGTKSRKGPLEFEIWHEYTFAESAYVPDELPNKFTAGRPALVAVDVRDIVLSPSMKATLLL